MEKHAGGETVAPREFDAMKGVLILLVALGHDTLVTHLIPWLFPALYNFHVAAFLLLPAVFKSKPISITWAKDHFVRYMVPYIIFVVVMASLRRAWVDPRGDVWQWGVNVSKAIWSGDSEALRSATGFSLFWFLPTLFVVASGRAVFERLGRKARWFGGAALLAMHCTCGLWPMWTRSVLPFGVGRAAFVLPLVGVFGVVWRRATSSAGSCLATATVAVATSIAVRQWLSVANIGELDIPSLVRPLALLLHDTHIVAAACTVVAMRPLLGVMRSLIAIGQRSLPIYLSHSQVFHAYLALVASARLSLPPLQNALVGSVVMFIGTAACVWVLRLPLPAQWLFPRTAGAWPPLRRRADGVRKPMSEPNR